MILSGVDGVKGKSSGGFALSDYTYDMSKVVVVRYPAAGSDSGLSRQQYTLLLRAGVSALSGEEDLKAATRAYVPSGVIGIKANCLVRKLNSTPGALTDALAQLLTDAGIDENDIVVWDRTSRELQGAGYSLNASSFGRRCLGTDAAGVGYGSSFYSSGPVNSLVSRVLTDLVSWNINLPVLKDHSIAGLSAGLKNMYGAVHNPNKYHDNNCDPFCAHVNNLEPIRTKNRLTILDAVKVQYHGGPGYVSGYIAPYQGIILSNDPVAADRVGLEILDHRRRINGLKSLEETGRPVRYLASAEKLGLGTAAMSKINLTVLQVDAAGAVSSGELL